MKSHFSLLHFVDKFRNAIVMTSIVVGMATTYYATTQVLKFAPRAGNNLCSQSACPVGASCTTGGQFCEVYKKCSNGTPEMDVYICDQQTYKWKFKNSQTGLNNCSFPQCTSTTTEPTPGGCDCSGGTYAIIFKTNRKLNNGEQISCSANSTGTCACNNKPCTGARRSGNCTIGAGDDECRVDSIDCSCKPFSYSCTGASSKSGSFAVAKNGSYDLVQLSLSGPTTAPTATRAPTPTRTPTPRPTNTPVPGQPTSPPAPTATRTPTSPPAPTTPPGQPTPTRTPTPRPTNTPVPGQPTPTPTLTPTITPTPIPGTTVTPTPTVMPTPTAPVIYYTPTPVVYIPQSGGSFEKEAWWSIGLVAFGILGVLIF